MRKIQNFDEFDNYENLILYCNEAIPLANKLKDYTAQMEAHRSRGFGFFSLNEIDLSIENFEKSLSIINCDKSLQKSIALSSIYFTLGYLYKRKHLYSKSLKCFIKALKNDFILGVKQSTSYNNLALLFRDVKDFDNAKRYLDYAISLECHETRISEIQKHRYIINLAGVLELKGELDSALELLESVKRQCLNSEDYQFMITMYRILGSVNIRKGNFNIAESMILKAMHLAENKKFRVELVSLHLLYSEILKHKGSFIECFNNLNLALEIAECSNAEDIDQVLLGLQNYYKEINDFHSHWQTMNRRFALSRRTLEKEVQDDFWKMKASFQLEETERQLELNRKRNMELQKMNEELIESLRSQRYLQLRLLTLQEHLCPEFVIAKLQTIQELIIDNRNLYASDCLVDFASLMRAILKSSREDRISLKEEVEVLKNLVSLAQMRKENLFDFVVSIDSSIDQEAIFPPSLVFLSLFQQALKDIQNLKTKSQICFVVRKFREDVFFHIYTRSETGATLGLEEGAEEFETNSQLIQRNRAILSTTMDKPRYFYRKSAYLSKACRVYSVLLVQ
ncbi:MAG: histidine kinase [Chitinophagales bacterium]